MFLGVAEVENNKGCQKWLLDAYEDSGSCLFGDIFSMVRNQIPEKTLMKVKQVKWKTKCPCLVHSKDCAFTFKDTLLVLGSPCVLFSKFLGFIMKPTPHSLRLGKREKFKNIAKAQCQVLAAAGMAAASISVHENVIGFDPSVFEQALSQKLHLAVPLGLRTTTPKCPSHRGTHSQHPASALRLSPQMFGSPTSRPREYRITHAAHQHWASAL